MQLSMAADKIAVCITEDWFALSHFKPLLRSLKSVAREVVVITRTSGRQDELAALGVRVVAFDYLRSSTGVIDTVATVRRLATLLKEERPDAVHLIALKPIVLGALALVGRRDLPIGVHLTGLGLLSIASGPKQRAVRRVALSVVGRLLVRPRAHLFVENEDDLAMLRRDAADPGPRVTVLGGAGVDPDRFAMTPLPGHEPPVIAYVGRMVKSKGVDVLVEAMRLLQTRGVAACVDLYGMIDRDNPEAISAARIAAWQDAGLCRWHGHVDDIAGVWRGADVFVMATLGGEGMPRAMLEAAAIGRPLVVTDVPGCRQFVRDGIEGFVVQPGDARALAGALHRLASDAGLRRTMADAARARVLDGYTEAHLEAAVAAAYRRMLAGAVV